MAADDLALCITKSSIAMLFLESKVIDKQFQLPLAFSVWKV